jgi:hypothetical protein
MKDNFCKPLRNKEVIKHETRVLGMTFWEKQKKNG